MMYQTISPGSPAREYSHPKGCVHHCPSWSAVGKAPVFRTLGMMRFCASLVPASMATARPRARCGNLNMVTSIFGPIYRLRPHAFGYSDMARSGRHGWLAITKATALLPIMVRTGCPRIGNIHACRRSALFAVLARGFKLRFGCYRILNGPAQCRAIKVRNLENCSVLECYSQQLTKTVMLAARLVNASGAICSWSLVAEGDTPASCRTFWTASASAAKLTPSGNLRSFKIG